MQASSKDSVKISGDETIRTRIDPTTKVQYESWCAAKSLTPSQVLRWIINMHLEQPDRLWNWLAEQDKKAQNDDSGKQGDHNGA